MQEKAKRKREGMTARLEKADRATSRRRLLWLGNELMWAGGAYLIGLGELLFDTKPLGVALLCAGGGHLISVLLGLILSELMLMQAPILMIATYAVTALIRAVSSLLLEASHTAASLPHRLRSRLEPEEAVSSQEAVAPQPRRLQAKLARLREELRGLMNESLALRMACAGVSMLVVSLYRIISGGFRYYDLFAAVFSILVAVAAVPVFSLRLEGRTQNRVLLALSSAALIYALVWSADHAAIGSIPMSVILAMLLTLCISNSHGAMIGAAAGILCGLAYDPLQAPAFLLAALICSGIKWKRVPSTGVPLALLAAGAWSYYVRGIASLTASLPAFLIAGACFTVFLRIMTQKSASAEEAERDPQVALQHERERHEDSNDRFRNISDAFSSLSEMFYNLSDRLRRPGTLDLRRICDSAFDSYCAECPNKSVCWGLEYSETIAATGSLISHLHTKGKVKPEQIPPALRRRCRSMDLILSQINAECARFTGELLRNNRTEILAMDYEAAANIINDALEEDAGEYRFDPELELRLQEYLTDAGITAQSVSVFGVRRRRILARGVNLDRATVTLETLRADAGEMCGLELSRPSLEVEGNMTSLLLQAKRKFSVSAAHKNLSADGGVSGDTVNLFCNQKDYFYALISDGMGAGKAAAFTSNLCSGFLEKMLHAGNRAGTSLRMLNNLILSRCGNSAEECSSTVDLIELDLITGQTSFIKGGAAPSFVLRKGRLHRLQAGTAPIGIIRCLDTETTRFDLRAGDCVVMISDGIMQEDPDCKWLTDFLLSCEKPDPNELVNKICAHAAAYQHHDDCSAVALLIEEAAERDDIEG